MFPFKTKKFSQLLQISATEFEHNLLIYADRRRFISVKKNGSNEATVSGGIMDWALSEVPTRNSFRPVIVLKWKGLEDKTLLTGYYRLSKGVLAFSFTFLLLGIVTAIKEQSIYPMVLIILLWSFIFQVLGFLLFRKEFDWVKGNFEDIIYEILQTAKVVNISPDQ